jgi:hypothetical protein
MAVERSAEDAQDQTYEPIENLMAFVRTCRVIEYSPRADILFLYPERLEGGYTVEPGGCIAYRVSYNDHHVVAIEVHNFKAIVLRENPRLKLAWDEYSSKLRQLLRRGDKARRFLVDKVAALVETCGDQGPGHFAHA